MGNRRMGARRLVVLNQKGDTSSDSSYQAGNGIKDAVVSHKIMKSGGIITTEILVDLQGKASGHTIHSPDTDGDAIGAHNGAADANEAAALAAAVEGCHLMVWENDVHGKFFESEVIVLEIPNGTQAADVDVEFADYAAANKLGTAVTTRLSLVAKGAALVAGDRFVVPMMDEDLDHSSPEATPIPALTDVDGKGLYLTADDDAPGLPYTQGKLQIILRGYDASWGF